MCIYVRNNHVTRRMRTIICLLLLSLLLTTCGTSDNSEEAVKTAFSSAFEELEAGEYEEFIRRVDDESLSDSVMKMYVLRTYMQYHDKEKKERGPLTSIVVEKVTFLSDSCCDVFADFMYADSVGERRVQRMTRKNDEWKLRLRN